MSLSWVEVSCSALTRNLARFRRIAPRSLLAPVVKANAYGHGLVFAAQTLVEGGADWLCVNAAFEAAQLRQNSIECPIYVLGHVPPSDCATIVGCRARVVVYAESTVLALSRCASSTGAIVPVHIKLETGNNRQGVRLEEALRLAAQANELPGVTFEGITSHYADIEDTTDHTFAKQQLSRFEQALTALAEAGMPPSIRSFSNSAATLLWNETHFELVRLGISVYGMWPSKETRISTVMLGRDPPELEPAMTWKTIVAQVKEVRPGDFVGYGRTFQATHPIRLAVLPIGYYDGYDRKLSNVAHVLIRGQIAPVRGRICMNMTMVDVTDIPGVTEGDEVVLLGRQGDNRVSAERLAEWSGTINYEVTTRINERIERRLVP